MPRYFCPRVCGPVRSTDLVYWITPALVAEYTGAASIGKNPPIEATLTGSAIRWVSTGHRIAYLKAHSNMC
eukprot:3934133-Rhodomonas_salina.5